MQHTSITIQPSNYLFHDKLGNQQGHVPVTPVSLPSNRFSAPKRSITMNFSGLSCCSFSTCPMYVHMNCRVSKYPETKKNINVKGSKHNINSIEFDNKLKGKCLVMSHRFPAGRGRGRQWEVATANVMMITTRLMMITSNDSNEVMIFAIPPPTPHNIHDVTPLLNPADTDSPRLHRLHIHVHIQKQTTHVKGREHTTG